MNQKNDRGRAIDIIGVPVDLGVRELGLKLGPDGFREAGLFEVATQAGLDVRDLGDVRVQALPERNNRTAKHLQSIAKCCRAIAAAVADSIQRGRTPVCLGGDHSLAIGSVAGAARAVKRLGCIWIDAHPDANTPSTTPSGNIHGMPVAVSLGEGPEELVGIAPTGRKLMPDHLSLLGCRDIDPGETELLRRKGVCMFTVFDIVERGLPGTVSEVIQRASRGTDGVHVSLDLDALRQEVAPGVGLPSSCGFDMREASYIAERISRECRVVSIDIVSFNPVRDVEQRTAKVGIELMTALLGCRLSANYFDYIATQNGPARRSAKRRISAVGNT